LITAHYKSVILIHSTVNIRTRGELGAASVLCLKRKRSQRR
jgi:hypothetical protein